MCLFSLIVNDDILEHLLCYRYCEMCILSLTSAEFVLSEIMSIHFASLLHSNIIAQLLNCIQSSACSSAFPRKFELGLMCEEDCSSSLLGSIRTITPKNLVQEYIKSFKDYYMPLWEPAEISKLWNTSYRYMRTERHVKELFNQWGGCVRWILEKPFEDSKNLLQKAVDSSTGESLLAACRGENGDSVTPCFACSVQLLSSKAREI